MPNTSLRVLRSANNVSVLPACSNTDQNTHAPRNNTVITTSRFLSSAVQPPLANNQIKNASTVSSNPVPKMLLTFSTVKLTTPVACNSPNTTNTAANNPSPFQNFPRNAAASTGPLTAGNRPASPSVRLSKMYHTTPMNMPTAVAPKPQCHEDCGEIPQPVSMFLNHCSCASDDVTNGASNAPRLMPM